MKKFGNFNEMAYLNQGAVNNKTQMDNIHDLIKSLKYSINCIDSAYSTITDLNNQDMNGYVAKSIKLNIANIISQILECTDSLQKFINESPMVDPIGNNTINSLSNIKPLNNTSKEPLLIKQGDPRYNYSAGRYEVEYIDPSTGLPVYNSSNVVGRPSVIFNNNGLNPQVNMNPPVVTTEAPNVNTNLVTTGNIAFDEYLDDLCQWAKRNNLKLTNKTRLSNFCYALNLYQKDSRLTKPTTDASEIYKKYHQRYFSNK